MPNQKNNTEKIQVQRREALSWFIPGLSSFGWLTITWQVTIRFERVSALFLTSLIILLATSIAFFVVRKKWIAIGIFCGVAVYIVLLPLLPPY